MKQTIYRNLNEIIVDEVPDYKVTANSVLVRSFYSERSFKTVNRMDNR